MMVNRSGSKIFGLHLTKAERQAFDIEVRKAFIENEELYRLDLIAGYLYWLHTTKGYGKKRLWREFDGFNNMFNEVVQQYLVDPADSTWVCKTKLKSIGVDVEEWDRLVNKPQET
jgi:hypothetical protein